MQLIPFACIDTVYTRILDDNFWLNFDIQVVGSAYTWVMPHSQSGQSA